MVSSSRSRIRTRLDHLRTAAKKKRRPTIFRAPNILQETPAIQKSGLILKTPSAVPMKGGLYKKKHKDTHATWMMRSHGKARKTLGERAEGAQQARRPVARRSSEVMAMCKVPQGAPRMARRSSQKLITEQIAQEFERSK